MYKYLVLGALSSLSFLSFIPAAHAYGDASPFGYEEDNNYYDQDDGYSNDYDRPARYSHHSGGRNIINIDLGNLSWEAYDYSGNFVRSGRVSGGKEYCPDIHRGCRTPTGTFTIYRKGGSSCKSSRFPVGKGGAPMPYCMFFKGGYALHGSYQVPDFNASHGCVRMIPSDAQWLNHNFVQPGSTRVKISY
jgi:hypothetical protein